MSASRKGGDCSSKLTAAELDFLDWYNMQDELLQAVTDLIVRQAREKGNSFLNQFGIDTLPDGFNVGFPAAA